MIIPEYLIIIAKAVASRSKCRRKIGCVLASKEGIIIATGYNGYPRGMDNCTEDTCKNPPGGNGECLAIHAEQNALLFANSIDSIYYVAVTRLPCIKCTMLLLNTQAKILIYEDINSYPESLELLKTKFQVIKI